MITSSNSRSFTTTFFANAFLVLAFGVTTAFAQTATTNAPSTSETAESFVSAAELLQNEVAFTPARVDMAAIKKSVQYPEVALKTRETGRFDIIVYVNNNGEVNTVNFVSERPESTSMNAMIAAACDAVKKARFTPAMLNNKAISSTVRIPFSFVM
ncbi:MAG: energy transducer TonB [Candidatus Kapaibacterium sp.]|nr:MAG: energy transducer TonB [Candidatus Kapabacteria bacterium]